MNISKFTQKSVQAVQDLEKVAYQFGNQEMEEEHLLYALLEQEDSLILKLIEKMEIDKDYFRNSLNQALDARVKVSGGELRFGQYLKKALVSAEDEAKAMGDEAKVSIRNIRRDYLSLLKEDDSMSDDYKDRVEEEIQKEVESFNKQVDEIVANKSKEIMTI